MHRQGPFQGIYSLMRHHRREEAPVAGSRFAQRVVNPARGGTLVVLLMSALAFTGTARAASTAVSVAPAEASVTGPSPAVLSFSLERSGDLGYETWLHFQTEDGTAKAGADYTSAGGD